MTRRYSDKEVSLILQRALEPSSESGPGLSLEQIKQIAAEVGVEPHRIEEAAATLLEPSVLPANPYAGIPTIVQFQTNLPGVDVTQLPRHEILDLIRGSLGRQGIVEAASDSLEWKARDAMGGRYVTLTPSPDGTRVRVLGNFRDGLLSFAGTVGIATFAMAALALKGAALGEVVTFVSAALVGLVPPPFIYRWWRKREDATMAKLHTKLLALLQRSSPSRSSDQSNDPEE